MEKTHIEEVDEFEYPLQVMKLAPLVLPDSGVVSRVRAFVLCMVYLLCVLLQVLVAVHFATSPLAITANLTMSAAFVSSSLHAIFRYMYMVIKKNKFEEIIRFISATPHLAELGEGAMRLNSTTKVRRRTNIIVMYNALVTAATFVIIFVVPSAFPKEEYSSRWNDTTYYKENHKPVYSEMWWPSDSKETLSSYIIFAYQMLVVLCNATSLATSDALVCALLLATSERSAMLARVAASALMPSTPNEKISNQFRAWVRCHQHYLIAFGRVNKLVGPIVFVTHFFTIINIIVFSYFSMKVDLFSAMVALAFLATVLAQVYTFAIAGQQLIDNSEELGRSTIGATQVARGGLIEGPTRTALLVLAARSSGAKPEELSGMGYFVVSVPLFSTVLGAAVSFILILLQFQ